MNRYANFLIFALTLLVLQGCTTPLSKSADRRTNGALIEDGEIEDKATTRIKTKYSDKVHITVTSYNRKVLVTGEAEDDAIKSDITRIIGGVQNVTAINNELRIALPASLSVRSGDTLTTYNVNLRLRDGGKEFKSDSVKVVTTSDIVYLMGIVTHAEGDIATEIARTSRGVKKVVPMFEYID